MTNKFIIIVPVYNAEMWIRNNLNSILSQRYKNFEVFITDDGSTDKTKDIIREYINLFPQKCHAIFNEHKECSLFSIICCKKESEKFDAKENDIFVTVDGDDWLYDDMVLDKLNTVYNSYNVWLTYGQYMRLSNSSKGHCKAINNTQKYRKHNAWLTSHIRTYRRHLWMKVEENDLKDQYGNYFNTAGDLAIMYPMIEMAGIKRIKFIEDILYLYNDMSPINDFKIKAEKQLEVASYIKQMRIYREIK